jgi:hypothetical protein
MDLSKAQSVCAAGDSSNSLETRVTLTGLSRGKLGENVSLEEYFSDFSSLP